MSNFETQYLTLLRKILREGELRSDRTGTGTISLFGERLQFDVLEEGFPLLTTKYVPFRSVLSELLWFIEGSGDERRLAEILHGTRDPSKKTIWSPNAEGTSGSNFKPSFPGDLGQIYGRQWRNWRGVSKDVDQLSNVIEKLKTNPTDRRMIVSAWNASELDNMALPPCHMMFQFYLDSRMNLHCQMYQRSVDTFLGLPFNCASYATLMYIVAKEVGATPGTLTMCLGDTHLYLDHRDQVKEQLSRPVGELPTLHITSNVSWDKLNMYDFTLVNYIHAPAIKAKMSA